MQFFTSYIVRTYALILVLGNNGIINRGIDQSRRRRATDPAAVPRGGSRDRADPRAAASHDFSDLQRAQEYRANLEVGGGLARREPLQDFFYVTLPLSFPGVFAGVVLVFLFDLTAYIMPGMLGGGYFNMVANVIQEQAMAVLDKRFAAAISIVLLDHHARYALCDPCAGSRMKGASA